MKTNEELNALREEVEALSEKLRALSEDELAQVTGGFSMKQKLLPHDIVIGTQLGVKPSSKTVETTFDAVT